jgi:hypothetical protein
MFELYLLHFRLWTAIFFLFVLLELSTQATLGFNSPSWKLSENRRESLVLQSTIKIINNDCGILYNINCEAKVLYELNMYLGISV